MSTEAFGPEHHFEQASREEAALPLVVNELTRGSRRPRLAPALTLQAITRYCSGGG